MRGPGQIKKVFQSSRGEIPSRGWGEIGDLHLLLDPDKAVLEIWTDGGAACVLRGEDFGRFLAWTKEKDYHG